MAMMIEATSSYLYKKERPNLSGKIRWNVCETSCTWIQFSTELFWSFFYGIGLIRSCFSIFSWMSIGILEVSDLGNTNQFSDPALDDAISSDSVELECSWNFFVWRLMNGILQIIWWSLLPGSFVLRNHGEFLIITVISLKLRNFFHFRGESLTHHRN